MGTNKVRPWIIVALLLLVPARQVNAVIDEIIGINSPTGGTLLVKRFGVTSGSVVVGIEIKNNDDRTIFPRIALLRGPLERLAEGSVLAESRNVGSTARHRVGIGFAPVVVQDAQDFYVVVQWPASDGVRGVGSGAGIGATRLDAPANCFIASRENDDFQALSVDLAIDLLYQSIGKATAGDEVSGHIVLRTFLVASNPARAGKNAIIDFGVERGGAVRLDIYDVAGRRLRTLVQQTLASGVYSREWDGRNDQGKGLAAGVYIVRLHTPNKTLSEKLVVTR